MAFVAAAHDERLDNKGIRAASRPTASRSKPASARWPTSSTPSPPSGRTAPIPVAEAIALMEKERDAAIDDDCLDALKQALPEFGF